MRPILAQRLSRICLTATLALAPVSALAQINPEIASCEEIQDEATQTQAEICASHLGCRLVLKIHSTCVKTKQFLTGLRNATSRLLTRKEIDDALPDAIVNALSLPIRDSVLDNNPVISAAIKSIHDQRTPSNVLETKYGVYYGNVRKGEPYLNGVNITSDRVTKTGYVKGEDGLRTYDVLYVGETIGREVSIPKKPGRPETTAFETNSSFEIKSLQPNFHKVGIAQYPTMEGIFDEGKLVAGKRFDAHGKTIEIVGGYPDNISITDLAIQWRPHHTAKDILAVANQLSHNAVSSRAPATTAQQKDAVPATTLAVAPAAQRAAPMPPQTPARTSSPVNPSDSGELLEVKLKNGARFTMTKAAFMARVPDIAAKRALCREKYRDTDIDAFFACEISAYGYPISHIDNRSSQGASSGYANCAAIEGDGVKTTPSGNHCTWRLMNNIHISLQASVRSKSGHYKSECYQQLRSLSQRSRSLEARIRQSQGMVKSLQAAMWIAQEHMAAGDRYCQSDPGWPDERAELQATYRSAEESCRQLSTDGTCKAEAP